MKGVLLVAVVCLGAGLGVVFGYCNGTTGLSFAYPLSGSSVHIDITTTGSGVPAAVGLLAVGAFLLVIATILALIGMFRGEDDDTPDLPSRRRESAFEE